jgi:OOP family OmpA-OmpF porin
VAERFGRIEAGAAALGTRATLELIGRTDPTGSDSANQALSRDRAEAVLAALAARGVSRGQTSVGALGTTRPLPADDPAERARSNRSVWVGVIVGPGAGREPSR